MCAFSFSLFVTIEILYKRLLLDTCYSAGRTVKSTRWRFSLHFDTFVNAIELTHTRRPGERKEQTAEECEKEANKQPCDNNNNSQRAQRLQQLEMANMIGNNHSGGNKNSGVGGGGPNYNNSYNSVADSGHSSTGGGGGGSGETPRLRDILNVGGPYQIPAGGCAYDLIIDLMRGLDLQDDGIVMNSKIKTIETDFCNIVRDESMLWYVSPRPYVCAIARVWAIDD